LDRVFPILNYRKPRPDGEKKDNTDRLWRHIHTYTLSQLYFMPYTHVNIHIPCPDSALSQTLYSIFHLDIPSRTFLLLRKRAPFENIFIPIRAVLIHNIVTLHPRDKILYLLFNKRYYFSECHPLPTFIICSNPLQDVFLTLSQLTIST